MSYCVNCGVELDPTRLVLNCRDGYGVAKTLMDRGIYYEMADSGHVVLIFTCADGSQTVAALTAAMNGLTAEGETQPSDKPETTDQPQATEKPAEKPAQTGDSAQLMLYVAALGAAVVALSTATVVRKRRGN